MHEPLGHIWIKTLVVNNANDTSDCQLAVAMAYSCAEESLNFPPNKIDWLVSITEL